MSQKDFGDLSKPTETVISSESENSPVQNASVEKTPVVIGEVFFDQFPDDRRILGGAPFDVAWNLQGLGEPPFFISAIGTDDEGKQIREKMDRHGMSHAGLQSREKYPAGKVEVSFDDGKPSYEIVADQAYDFVKYDADVFDPKSISLIYQGSRAWRGTETRKAIRKIRQSVDAPVFVDLNIRKPSYDPALLADILSGVRWLKLNADDLQELTEMPVASQTEIVVASIKLIDRYGFESLFVTEGARDAYCVQSGGDVLFAPAPEPAELIDTVGAGDSFSVAAIPGLSRQWEIAKILKNAVAFAARVCGLRGATTDDAGFYYLENDTL